MCRVDPAAVEKHLLAAIRSQGGVQALVAFQTLQEKGVIVGDVRKHTLGAGTNFASGQTPCFVINLSHSLMTDTGPLLKVVQ